MFEHNLTEKQENHIIIEDIELDVVKEMVRFMYTAEAPNLTKLARGLLIAAEKYDLQSLKDRCEKHLIPQVCVENAIDTLMLADKYNANYLEQEVLKFIDTHYHDVCQRKEWLTMNADLLNKLLNAIKNEPTASKRAKV